MRPSKIVCVGRSYAAHAAELGNAISTEPVLFIKPPSSMFNLDQGISWNKELGECHFECELSLKISKSLKNEKDPQAALKAVGFVSLGLDLTLRDLQTSLKDKGLPWERAKAFDGSSAFGDWISVSEFSNLQKTTFKFLVNNEIKQKGDTSLLLFEIGNLIANISQSFSLEVGDIIMTGTPPGVGPLKQGDKLQMNLTSDKTDYLWNTFVS